MPECRVAWNAIAPASQLPCYGCRSEAGPIGRPRTPRPRPRRARRQRSTPSRYFTNAGVACLAQAGIAVSLTASVTPTAAPWLTCPRPRGSPFGAEHVPRIRRGVRHGPRPDAGSRSGACPGKGILGRIAWLLPAGGLKNDARRAVRPSSRTPTTGFDDRACGGALHGYRAGLRHPAPLRSVEYGRMGSASR